MDGDGGDGDDGGDGGECEAERREWTKHKWKWRWWCVVTLWTEHAEDQSVERTSGAEYRVVAAGKSGGGVDVKRRNAAQGYQDYRGYSGPKPVRRTQALSCWSPF